MPLSRDDFQEAMDTLADYGEASGVLVSFTRWQWLSRDEAAAKRLLMSVQRLGLKARDVLDQMEENDA